MLDALKDVRAKLVELVRLAWNFDATDPVELGPPRQAWTSYPQATIVTSPVSREMIGPRIVEEVYGFEIEGRFEVPNDGTLDDLKVDKAQSLGELLCPDAVEVGGAVATPDPLVLGAYLAQVTLVDFGQDSDTEPWYSVRLEFSVRFRILQ